MSRVVLPKTPQAKRWVRCTDELRAHLKQRLDKLKAEFSALEREVAQIEGAIALLDQLLPPSEPRPIAVPAEPRRWSQMYDACIRCERSDRPHQSRGLCTTCYQQEVRQQRVAS